MKYPRCCNKNPKFLITYDCGPEKNQTILVCESHYAEEPFNKFVIQLERIES